jgi:hypothetical protein
VYPSCRHVMPAAERERGASARFPRRHGRPSTMPVCLEGSDTAGGRRGRGARPKRQAYELSLALHCADTVLVANFFPSLSSVFSSARSLLRTRFWHAATSPHLETLRSLPAPRATGRGPQGRHVTLAAVSAGLTRDFSKSSLRLMSSHAPLASWPGWRVAPQAGMSLAAVIARRLGQLPRLFHDPCWSPQLLLAGRPSCFARRVCHLAWLGVAVRQDHEIRADVTAARQQNVVQRQPECRVTAACHRHNNAGQPSD